MLQVSLTVGGHSTLGWQGWTWVLLPHLLVFTGGLGVGTADTGWTPGLRDELVVGAAHWDVRWG